MEKWLPHGKKAFPGTGFLMPCSSPKLNQSAGVRQSYSVLSNISKGKKLEYGN